MLEREEAMSDDRLNQVAAYAASCANGLVLTHEILNHGGHMASRKRDPKCLYCYPTIVLN